MLVDDTLQQENELERLQLVDYNTFAQERSRWNERLHEGIKRNLIMDKID